jgi:hypothetical protein
MKPMVILLACLVLIGSLFAVTITTDTTLAGDSAAILINASGVTLDCAGYYVDTSIISNFGSTTIKNCWVKHYNAVYCEKNSVITIVGDGNTVQNSHLNYRNTGAGDMCSCPCYLNIGAGSNNKILNVSGFWDTSACYGEFDLSVGTQTNFQMVNTTWGGFYPAGTIFNGFSGITLDNSMNAWSSTTAISATLINGSTGVVLRNLPEEIYSGHKDVEVSNSAGVTIENSANVNVSASSSVTANNVTTLMLTASTPYSITNATTLTLIDQNLIICPVATTFKQGAVSSLTIRNSTACAFEQMTNATISLASSSGGTYYNSTIFAFSSDNTSNGNTILQNTIIPSSTLHIYGAGNAITSNLIKNTTIGANWNFQLDAGSTGNVFRNNIFNASTKLVLNSNPNDTSTNTAINNAYGNVLNGAKSVYGIVPFLDAVTSKWNTVLYYGDWGTNVPYSVDADLTNLTDAHPLTPFLANASASGLNVTITSPADLSVITDSLTFATTYSITGGVNMTYCSIFFQKQGTGFYEILKYIACNSSSDTNTLLGDGVYQVQVTAFDSGGAQWDAHNFTVAIAAPGGGGGGLPPIVPIAGNATNGTSTALDDVIDEIGDSIDAGTILDDLPMIIDNLVDALPNIPFLKWLNDWLKDCTFGIPNLLWFLLAALLYIWRQSQRPQTRMWQALTVAVIFAVIVAYFTYRQYLGSCGA